MNKLLKEFLSYILTEERVKREVGAVWQTPSKKWSAKRADRTQGGFASREAAQAWLSGKGKEPGQEKPTDEKPEQLPPEVVRVKSPERYMGGEPQPETGDTEKSSVTGATIYKNPIDTPAGNMVDAEFKPEDIEKITSSVNKVIDDRAATDDSLPDQMDIEAHLGRTLPDSNDEYYKRRKIKNPQRIPDDLRQQLRASGVPDTHLDMIERAINTQTDGDNPPFSEIAGSAVGMGKPSSQAGELMAMTLMAVPRDKRAGVASTVEGLISATGLKTPTLDASWVQAGLNQAEAFDSMMDSRFGQGNWTVETTAWDTREDMDGIGLTPENKGFSTDVAIRIRLKNGEAKVARLSLKKNGEIFLLNGTTNDVIGFALSGLSGEGEQSVKTMREIERLLPLMDKNPEARQELAILLGVDPKLSKDKLKAAARVKRDELEDAAIESIQDEKTRERVRTIRDFPKNQHSSAVRLGQSISKTTTISKNDIKQAAKENEWTPADAKLAARTHAVLRKLPANSNEATIRDALETAGITARPQAKLRKAMLFAAQLEATRNPEVKQMVDEHRTLTTACGNAAIDAVMDDSKVMEGLMVKLEETFPVRVIASGQESMCLGGVPVSKETCEAMFGTSDPNQIQKGLRIVTKEGPPPERILMYTSEGVDGKEVPIAVVRPREKGMGYRGTVGLEFQATRQFECAAAEANVQANQTNPANDRIVKKCQNRSKRGKK